MKLKYSKGKIFVQGARNEITGLKRWFNRFVENYMFSPLYKNKLWNGKRTRYNKDENSVPFGLWQEVYRCANEHNYDINFINKKDFPLNRDIKEEDFKNFVNSFFKGYMYKGKEFKPRPYQMRIAYKILKNRYCNIAVATSGGKTLIFALVFFYLLHNNKDRKFLLVVPSKTLVTQFYDDLINFDWNNKLDLNIGEIYGKEEKPRISYPDKDVNLYIGTFQSLSNSKNYPRKWFKQFYSITLDEGHKSKSESYKKILNHVMDSTYYRWGMSGTFPKIDTYEMMEIMSKTGPVVDKVSARELMDAGYITKVKIKSILMNHNDYEFSDLLEIVASKDKKSAYDLEVDKIQQSEKRIGVINQIVSECKSNTLVLFHNTEYGHKLLEHLEKENPDKIFHYIDGKVSNKKRTPIKKDMENTDRIRVLVASFGTLSTGVSITSITNIIFTQSFKKHQVIIQSIGRALRLHEDKKYAYIFDLVDIFNKDEYVLKKPSKFKNILYSHYQKRLKIYNEEEYPESSMIINL